MVKTMLLVPFICFVTGMMKCCSYLSDKMKDDRINGKYLKYTISEDTIFRRLEDASLVPVIQIFEQISRAKQELNDFYQDAQDNKFCVCPDDVAKIATMVGTATTQESSFQTKLSVILKNVRSGKGEASELADLLKSFQQSDLSPQAISITLSSWATVTEKVQFSRALKNSGARYIGFGASLDEEIFSNFDKKMCVLYISYYRKSEYPEQWLGNRRLFLQEMKKKQENVKWYAVDCDIHPKLMRANCNSFIQILEAGEVIIDNLLEQENLQRVAPKQTKSSNQQLWDFRLNDPNEITLLIVGETASGKTTWINQLVNILVSGALEKAKDNDLCALIPSKFLACDVTYKQVSVSTGSDPNEYTHSTYKTDTQQARVYKITTGNFILKIIDTPGVGDARGVAQDSRNIQCILKTLSSVKKIDAICVFLNPTTMKLSTRFRYCLQELLMHFHRDAAKNILFCRNFSTSVHLGNTDLIEELKRAMSTNSDIDTPLSQDNLYCFDNSSYRYLAALKSTPSVYLSRAGIANASTSWGISKAELTRMLKYVRSLQPHEVNNTLMLNKARELVLSYPPVISVINHSVRINPSPGKLADLEKVKEASVKLAHFVKINSMLAFNDAMEEYLDAEIRENTAASERNSDDGDNSAAESCHELKRKHIKDKNTLIQEMQKSGWFWGASPDLDQAQQVMDELQSLNNFKGELKAIVKRINPTDCGWTTELVLKLAGQNLDIGFE